MTLKSEGEERDCNRRISSANKKSFTEEGKWRSERSLMKIRNKSGPRIDPHRKNACYTMGLILIGN